jgi:AhpD family alkylhydroperoxidase
MTRHAETLRELREPTRSLRHAIPEVWAGFAGLHDAAMAEGELPSRVKEAAALAMAVIKGCGGCIAYHARSAARAGATPGEVAELLGVALLMDGGTASVHAPRAWEAFGEFSGSTAGASSSRDVVPAVVAVDHHLKDEAAGAGNGDDGGRATASG